MSDVVDLESWPARILVPVDLSERSERAVTHAARLARLAGADLVMAINVNLPERAVLEQYAADEHLDVDAAARAALASLAHRLAPGVAASAVASFADFPADGILAVAETERVDLIVIASHGRGGMKRLLLGSVAEKIAREAQVPMVIVPARD